MKLHANAPLGVKGRQAMVERIEVAGWSLTAAAEASGVSERTARKWRDRWRAEGLAGLIDRSSAPRSVPNRTDKRIIQLLAALRRLRFTAPELADLLDDAGVDDQRDPQAARDGQARPAGTRARRAL